MRVPLWKQAYCRRGPTEEDWYRMLRPPGPVWIDTHTHTHMVSRQTHKGMNMRSMCVQDAYTQTKTRSLKKNSSTHTHTHLRADEGAISQRCIHRGHASGLQGHRLEEHICERRSEGDAGTHTPTYRRSLTNTDTRATQ